MERKASFSIRKPKRRSSQHNSREDKPKYLIEQNENFYGNFYRRFNGYKNDLQMSFFLKKLYQKKIGQKMQKKQIPALIKEVVISLKKDHAEKDVISLFDTLRKKYGGHEILELAIHRDEGHFEDENGLTYYPNREIFYYEEDEKWYLDREFKEPAPENLTKVYNHHAHIKFTMMDLSTAKTPQMPKSKYSQRHKVVADFLGMRYEPGRTRLVKKSVIQVKNEYSEKREKQKDAAKEKKELKTTISSLQEQLAENGKITQKQLAKLKEEYRKEMIASKLHYAKEDYQRLSALFLEAKKLNKSKDLDLDKLKEEIEGLKNRKITQEEVLSLKTKFGENIVTIGEAIQTQNNEIEELKNKIGLLRGELDTKDAQIVTQGIRVAELERELEQRKAEEEKKSGDLSFEFEDYDDDDSYIKNAVNKL